MTWNTIELDSRKRSHKICTFDLIHAGKKKGWILMVLRWRLRLRTTNGRKWHGIFFCYGHKVEGCSRKPFHFLKVHILAPRIGAGCRELWSCTVHCLLTGWGSHWSIFTEKVFVRFSEAGASPRTWLRTIHGFFLRK